MSYSASRVVLKRLGVRKSAKSGQECVRSGLILRNSCLVFPAGKPGHVAHPMRNYGTVRSHKPMNTGTIQTDAASSLVAVAGRHHTTRLGNALRRRFASGDARGPGGAVAMADSDGVLVRGEGWAVRALLPADVEATAAAVAHVWCSDNVMMLNFGVTEEELLPLATLRVRKAAELGQSVILTTPEGTSGGAEAVLGFFIWEDFSDCFAKTGEASVAPAKLAPQGAFIRSLQRQYVELRGGSPPAHGHSLHGIYGGVRSEVEGKKLVTTLLDLSAKCAARAGYKRLVTEAVAVGSQQASYRLGWTDVCLKQYTNFEFEGEFPLKGVPLKARTPCAVMFELYV